MSFIAGTFSEGTTGNHSVTGFGFKPAYLRFTISQKLSTTQNFVHLSQGFTDGTSQSCHSIFQDSTSASTRAYTDRCINHLDRVAGVLTETIKATFVSFDASGFTLNFTAVDANYQIHVEAFA